MTITQIEEQIFNVGKENFEELAVSISKYQYATIPIYKKYMDALGISVSSITSLQTIPFLPIQFFKTHQVISESAQGDFTIFESSGTTGQIASKHFVQDINLYKRSFSNCFEFFFGQVNEYCILGLLPSYLERGNSSLVYMVDNLIRESKHSSSGFYLHNHAELYKTILDLEEKKQASVLIGVTYALLDFAEKYPMQLNYTVIIETGGMKGRREELLRDEVHTILKKSFEVPQIYSEYGMTELLSQAYLLRDGIFHSPNWMKLMVRDINDPFQVATVGKGVLNVIDLANIHSCCFIATDDVGEVFADGSFLVNGRLDAADLRGCSLMLL